MAHAADDEPCGKYEVDRSYLQLAVKCPQLTPISTGNFHQHSKNHQHLEQLQQQPVEAHPTLCGASCGCGIHIDQDGAAQPHVAGKGGDDAPTSHQQQDADTCTVLDVLGNTILDEDDITHYPCFDGVERPTEALVGNVIFLDVDGVLHPLDGRAYPAGCRFDELVARGEEEMKHEVDETDTTFASRTLPQEFLEVHLLALKRIVHETSPVHIVLSTTWREMGVSTRAVARELATVGIPLPIGKTPGYTFNPNARAYGRKRGAEIMHVVRQSPGITGFVVLDDDHFSLGSDALDRRHFPLLDSAEALTEAKADAAIACIKAGMI
jgi:hypothetical protein